MKKANVLLLIAAFLLPAMNLMAQEKKETTDEKMVIVKGNESWKNIQIKIYPKDVIIFKATGKVCFHSGISQSCVDPDGLDVNEYKTGWVDDYQQCFDPIKEANHAGLIGNVGDEVFFIGKGNKFTGKEGFLYLQVNDCTLDEGKYSNTGQFEVYISVERHKK